MRLTTKKREEIVHFESTIKFKDLITAKYKELQSVIETQLESKLPQVALPKEWEPYISKCRFFYANGESYGYYFFDCLGKPVTSMELSKDIYHRNDDNRYDIDLKDKNVSKVLKEFKELMKEKSDFSAKLKAVLNAFTTVDRLLKEMPDLENHFKNTPVKSKAIVPYKEIKEVSASLVRPIEVK